VKYQTLKPGDKIKRGDEWKNWLTGGWSKTVFVGRHVRTNPQYRRPIKPKKKGSK
jgi:hypothetical protein